LKSDIELPGSSFFSAMTEECSRRAADARLPSLQAAVSAYNAARAYNALGQYESAARLGHQWLQRVPNSDPAIDKLTRRRKQQTAARFRQSRVYEQALALNTLGMTPGEASRSPLPGAPFAEGQICAPRGKCLLDAQALLDDASLLAPFERTCERASFGEFILLRGMNRKALALAGGPDWAVQSSRAQADFTELLVRESCKASGLQGRARNELVNLLLEDGNRYLTSEDVGALPAAVRAYQAALEQDQGNFRARLGLGKSYLQLASTLELQDSEQAPAILRGEGEPKQAYGRAIAAFEAARKAAPRGDLLQGEAFEGEATALLGFAGASQPPLSWPPLTPALRLILGPPPPLSPETQTLARRAAAAAESAIAVQSTPFRHRLHAAARLLAGDDATVAQDYIAAVNADLANGPPANVVSSVLLEIGKYLLGRDERALAEEYFQEVVRLNGGASNAAPLFRYRRKADAYFGLSVIASMDGDYGRAVSYAERAVLAGGQGASPYWEQLCLTQLVRGGPSFASDGAAAACAGQPGAKGRLFGGLYHLRAAQRRSHYDGVQHLDLAKVAFDEGRGLLRNTPGPNANVLRILLEYGYAKAVTCSGLSQATALDRAQISWAAEQFDTLGVRSC